MPIYSAEEYDERYWDSVERHPLPTDCATSNYPRLIHPEETWRFLQEVYHDQTYARKSYHHRIHARHRHLWYSGLDEKYAEVRDNGDGRGRGVYAKRDIPMGTKIWYFAMEWVINDGVWHNEEKMLGYLERLPHDLQCDVLLWAYASDPVKQGRRGMRYVECNLDEASFFNHGERPELVNIRGFQNLATRYIREGEELLMDYNTFIATGDDSIQWWDELRNMAWKEAESAEQDSPDTQANSSSSTASEAAVEGIMDGYVNYGAPKAKAAASTSSVFVDALPIHGGRATHHGFSSVLAGLCLAWVVARGFAAATGIRRRR